MTDSLKPEAMPNQTGPVSVETLDGEVARGLSGGANVPRAMRDEISQQFAKPRQREGWFRRLIKATASAEAPRQPCAIVAVMITVDKRVALDGMVLAVSRAGMLFRQASTFIFDRQGQTVVLRYAGVERAGQIDEVSPEGYWVRFSMPLDQATLDALIAQFTPADPAEAA